MIQKLYKPVETYYERARLQIVDTDLKFMVETACACWNGENSNIGDLYVGFGLNVRYCSLVQDEVWQNMALYPCMGCRGKGAEGQAHN